MIGLGFGALLMGTVYQENRQRSKAGSGWFPTFKVVGFVGGTLYEYADVAGLYIDEGLRGESLTEIASFSAILLLMLLVFIPAALLHIYYPQTRGGWCYLSSAAAEKTVQLRVAHLQSKLNARSGYSLCKLDQRVKVKLGLVVTVTGLISLHGHLNLENTEFYLWVLADCDNEGHILPVFALLFLASYASCLLLQTEADRRSANDTMPALRVHQGFTSEISHFYDQKFFVYHEMPGKFFKYIGLEGTLELGPNMRRGKVCANDASALSRTSDHCRGVLFAEALDTWFFARLRMDNTIETYYESRLNGRIYDTWR